jgi:hypothetical protein
MRVIKRFLVNDRNNTRVALPGLTVQATSHNSSQDLRCGVRRKDLPWLRYVTAPWAGNRIDEGMLIYTEP